MNNYFFKREKVVELLDYIKKEFVSDKSLIERAFNMDYEDWEFDMDFNILLDQIENIKKQKYLPVFSKEKVVDGLGKIALVCNQNPYLIFNFVLSCIYTNNKVEVVLGNKMLATNKIILEVLKKVLDEQKVEFGTVSYIELSNQDDIISKQDNYDLIYYFGNKNSYINFVKRLHIDSRFEECGIINLYSDSKDFKETLVEIDKWAYLNEIKINFYNKDIEEAIKEINKYNSLGKMTIIISKDFDKITKFIREVKTENIYVNTNPVSKYKYETDLNNLVYTKNINW